MKNKKPVREETLQIRTTTPEMNRLKGLARLYAGGNVSLYVIMHSINGNRMHVTEEDRKKMNRRLK